jgi:hypothetical protein
MRESEAKVRDWLLAILRFAVTLEQSDKAAAATMAQNLDGAESGYGQARFRFFTKTNSEFCDAIADRDSPRAANTLESHLRRIEDVRLRRALEAAIGATTAPAVTPIPKRSNYANLWKGLPQR